MELRHIPISKICKRKIEEDLEYGLEPNIIIKKKREEAVVKGHMSRDDLITHDEIKRLKYKNNISDSTSVENLIEDSSTILFHKQVGETCPTLESKDMVLIYQSDFQKNLMTKWGGSNICIDSTYKITKYKYILTTILVVDESKNGYPVAFMLSNREDSAVMKIFFTEIRKNIGNLETINFMSDIAHHFYLSWCEVFTKPHKRHYCMWHLFRAWKKNLNLHIGLPFDLSFASWLLRVDLLCESQRHVFKE